MAAWKVKAVAIQFRPTTNWPTPNSQPIKSARRRPFVCHSSQSSIAKAAGIISHSPAGSKAKADAAPVAKATGKTTLGEATRLKDQTPTLQRLTSDRRGG